MMRLDRKLLFFLGLAILAVAPGCGGGGGDRTTPTPGGGATLRYTTDWGDSDRAITGVSQRISIYNSASTLLGSERLDQSSPEPEVLFSNLLPGTYRAYIELFSGPNQTGTRTGLINTLFEVTTLGGELKTEVGGTAADVVINPQGLIVRKMDQIQFYAHAISTSGALVFTPEGTWTWSLEPESVGLLNPKGMFMSPQLGEATVKVMFGSSSLAATSRIIVKEPFGTTSGSTGSIPGDRPEGVGDVTRSKWTVLVYMNAVGDLQTFSKNDINEMERVADNPDVRFVVQWKQIAGFDTTTPPFSGTRRYQVQYDLTENIRSRYVENVGSNVDMGDWRTLRDFVEWGKANYPSDRTILVIWNHGNGWVARSGDMRSRAVSFDPSFGNSAIDVWELPDALAGHHFDILSFDASLMQMLEVAYEIRDFADYIVGSEESPPGDGLPYHRVFDEFRDFPDRTTRQLSKAFVDGMLEEPSYRSRAITQSVVDTSQLDNLASKVDTLALDLIANKSHPSMGTLMYDILMNAQTYDYYSYWFYDLWDVCNRLQNGLTGTAVETSAAAVKTALSSAIVWEGHNANSPGSHGLSIDLAPPFSWSDFHTTYQNLAFAQFNWDEWLSQMPLE